MAGSRRCHVGSHHSGGAGRRLCPKIRQGQREGRQAGHGKVAQGSSQGQAHSQCKPREQSQCKLPAVDPADRQIESLYDDIDYKAKFSRAELETIVADSRNLFMSPIRSALDAASITLDDLTSLILFGGNTRVPFVQSAIKEVLGSDDKIAQNVNADEAAVLGAAYYGAALSRQFKMKNIELIERSVRETSVEPAGEVVFPVGTPHGTKKTLAFAAKDDFTLEFAQGG